MWASSTHEGLRADAEDLGDHEARFSLENLTNRIYPDVICSLCSGDGYTGGSRGLCPRLGRRDQRPHAKPTEMNISRRDWRHPAPTRWSRCRRCRPAFAGRKFPASRRWATKIDQGHRRTPAAAHRDDDASASEACRAASYGHRRLKLEVPEMIRSLYTD